jgi:putative phosphoesterase
MKIAVISDSHDNLANLKKALSIIEKEDVELLIHCGDIFEPETAREILKNFSGKVHFVLSGVDEDYFKNIGENYFKNFPHLKIWKKFGEIEIDGKKIAFSHSPKTAFGLAFSQKLAPHRADKVGSGAGYNIIFYGHLHKPWEVKIRKTKLVNPGNIAGLFFRASLAIYDTKTDKLELKIL